MERVALYVDLGIEVSVRLWFGFFYADNSGFLLPPLWKLVWVFICSEPAKILEYLFIQTIFKLHKYLEKTTKLPIKISDEVHLKSENFVNNISMLETLQKVKKS